MGFNGADSGLKIREFSLGEAKYLRIAALTQPIWLTASTCGASIGLGLCRILTPSARLRCGLIRLIEARHRFTRGENLIILVQTLGLKPVHNLFVVGFVVH